MPRGERHGYATCPFCGRVVQVTAQRKLWHHPKVREGYEERARCPGSYTEVPEHVITPQRPRAHENCATCTCPTIGV